MSKRKEGVYGFFNEYRWLSNFYPVVIHMWGMKFPDVETAYQFAKLDVSMPIEEFNTWKHEFLNCKRPGDAKKMGASLKTLGLVRKDWFKASLDVMYECLREKFKNASLRAKLLATDNLYLEESNNWNDTFYGVCKGVGENHLGKLLMKLREEIRDEENARTT